MYVNGQDTRTGDQYYQQFATTAATGTQADAPPDGDWLPLGVFALSKPNQTKPKVTIQLAVSKQGVLRGNYTDTETNQTQTVQGSVDKQSQQVAFTADYTADVVETGPLQPEQRRNAARDPLRQGSHRAMAARAAEAEWKAGGAPV